MASKQDPLSTSLSASRIRPSVLWVGHPRKTCYTCNSVISTISTGPCEIHNSPFFLEMITTCVMYQSFWAISTPNQMLHSLARWFCWDTSPHLFLICTRLPIQATHWHECSPPSTPLETSRYGMRVDSMGLCLPKYCWKKDAKPLASSALSQAPLTCN